MFWQDPTYTVTLFSSNIRACRLSRAVEPHFLNPFPPPFLTFLEVFRRQSVDGEDAGKRIFAHLFEEDIQKQAVFSPVRSGDRGEVHRTSRQSARRPIEDEQDQTPWHL